MLWIKNNQNQKRVLEFMGHHWRQPPMTHIPQHSSSYIMPSHSQYGLAPWLPLISKCGRNDPGPVADRSLKKAWQPLLLCSWQPKIKNLAYLFEEREATRRGPSKKMRCQVKRAEWRSILHTVVQWCVQMTPVPATIWMCSEASRKKKKTVQLSLISPHNCEK